MSAVQERQARAGAVEGKPHAKPSNQSEAADLDRCDNLEESLCLHQTIGSDQRSGPTKEA
jgi:hypothetical protein